MQLEALSACHAETRKVAFHIGAEDRDTFSRKTFGQDLQGDRLASARGPGDYAVPVRPVEKQLLGLVLFRPAAANIDPVAHPHAP